MNGKIKNMIQTGALISLMTVFPNNYEIKSQNNLISTKNNNLENIVSSSKTSQDFSFLKSINSLNDQYQLIERASKSDVQESNIVIDSVAKFVEKDVLIGYFNKNNISLEIEPGNKDTYALNRLRVLTYSGRDVEKLRFESAGRGRSQASLRNLASTLGVQIGVAEHNPDKLKAYFNLYKEDIVAAAEKNNISPELFASVLKHESGFSSFAISPTGPIGIGQIASWLYRENESPFNGKHNIYLAAEFLGNLVNNKYSRFNDSNNILALTAYNQGEPTLNRSINIARSEGNRSIHGFLNQKYPVNHEIEKERGQYIIPFEGRAYAKKVLAEKRGVHDLFNDSAPASHSNYLANN
ncbi:MAG: transglycosylase SLT domain-containing protein [Candidatus Woesearchaeota archaeon]